MNRIVIPLMVLVLTACNLNLTVDYGYVEKSRTELIDELVAIMCTKESLDYYQEDLDKCYAIVQLGMLDIEGECIEIHGEGHDEEIDMCMRKEIKNIILSLRSSAG